MAFIVEKIGQTRKPEGHYLSKNGIDWLIADISISASGLVSLRVVDPVRKESQMIKAGTIEELADKTEGFNYKECI